VLGDVLHVVDSGLAVVTLLDLWAAFDTVEYATLLRRLNVTYTTLAVSSSTGSLLTSMAAHSSFVVTGTVR